MTNFCLNLKKKTEWKYTVKDMWYFLNCIWKIDKKKLYPSIETDEETLTVYLPYNMHCDKITSSLLPLSSVKLRYYFKASYTV